MECSVGQVQSIADSRANYAGSGFTINDKMRRPLLTLGYGSDADAFAARSLMVMALENVKYVGAPSA